MVLKFRQNFCSYHIIIFSILTKKLFIFDAIKCSNSGFLDYLILLLCGLIFTFMQGIHDFIFNFVFYGKHVSLEIIFIAPRFFCKISV